jgi:predicted CoA-binding protein
MHMSSAKRSAIDQFVSQPAMALVGVSRSGKKFGNLAYRELSAKGYRVYPIHRAGGMAAGAHCYTRFAALPERVNAVLVVVPPAQAAMVVREAAQAGIQHVWLQQGAESSEVLKICDELGLTVVSGECILMYTQPTGYHKAHRWLWQILGKLAA